MFIPPYDEAEAAIHDPILLVVASDRLTRGLFQRLFQDERTLRFVEDAPAVLEALRRETVDLIVLDVTARELDGIGVLKQIRGSECGATQPVILISDLHDNQTAVQGLQQGASDYITRPLDENVVRARVNT